MTEPNNMSKPYLITFTPINRFFFGGSYSLGEGFYAESLKFPQPTTVLGCIRNTILIQNGFIDIDQKNFPDFSSDKAKQLTGTSEIKNLDEPDDNFGVVVKVSPVFIVKQKDNKTEDILFPAPADIMKDKSSLTYFGYTKTKDAISSYSGRRVDFAIRSERNPKSSDANYLGGKCFWDAYMNNRSLPYVFEYDEDKIFIAHTCVGITRENRIAKEGAFYTKIDYSLKDSFSFGVIAWFTEEGILKDDVVILGGEQSAFIMKIIRLDDSISKCYPVVEQIIKGECDLSKYLEGCSGEEKLIALSPILFGEISNCSFADAMEHRIVNGIHSTRIVKKKSGKEKSEAVCMIPAGSVFYPQKVKLTINSWKIPYKIGYNYALKIERR